MIRTAVKIGKIKSFTLVRKSAAVDDAAFQRYWRDEVAKSLLRSPVGESINRMVHNHVLEHDFRRKTNARRHLWSGVGEYYFDDGEAALRAIADPAFASLAEQHREVVSEVAHVLINEILMYDHLKNWKGVKVFGLYKRSLPVTREKSHEHWYGPHAQMGLDIKADLIIRKYTQNHTLLDYRPANPEYDYDGASIVWFDDVAGAASIYQNDEVMKIAGADEPDMGVGPGDVVSLLTDEVEVYSRRS
jgi:hypothetical protein